jgi:hypothetical protein
MVNMADGVKDKANLTKVQGWNFSRPFFRIFDKAIYPMGVFGKILSYITFRRQNVHKRDYNLKMMHGINRISIFMFLLAIIVMIIRALS